MWPGGPYWLECPCSPVVLTWLIFWFLIKSSFYQFIILSIFLQWYNFFLYSGIDGPIHARSVLVRRIQVRGSLPSLLHLILIRFRDNFFSLFLHLFVSVFLMRAPRPVIGSQISQSEPLIQKAWKGFVWKPALFIFSFAVSASFSWSSSSLWGFEIFEKSRTLKQVACSVNKAVEP